MKHIATYIESGRTFEICKAEGLGDADGYWAIEDKDIDESGRLKRQLNGISGHHSSSVAEAIQKVSNMVRCDALVAQGMDRMEAAWKVVNGLI